MGEVLAKRLKQNRLTDVRVEAYLNMTIAVQHLKAEVELIYGKFGLTQSQFNVLRILKGVHPDGHPRYEISERMVVRSPDVTRLLNRLERRGLIHREKSDSDKRLSLTRITAKGLNLLQVMEPSRQQFLDLLGSKMSDQEYLELSRLCEKLYAEAE